LIVAGQRCPSLTVTFPPHERAKAIGAVAGMSGFGAALGPTLGGYMVEHLGWESLFFLTCRSAIVAFIGGHAHRPEIASG
jgi:MFS family permease